MNSPDPNSLRSKKRESRGFLDLKTSSRKHRRANKRSIIARKIGDTVYKAGERIIPTGEKFQFNAGGSLRYA